MACTFITCVRQRKRKVDKILKSIVEFTGPIISTTIFRNGWFSRDAPDTRNNSRRNLTAVEAEKMWQQLAPLSDLSNVFDRCKRLCTIWIHSSILSPRTFSFFFLFFFYLDVFFLEIFWTLTSDIQSRFILSIQSLILYGIHCQNEVQTIKLIQF